MSCGCGSSTHAGCSEFSVRPCTTRVDIVANAGELFDLLVPILDADNAPVNIPVGLEVGWAAEAMVRRNPLAGRALQTWTTAGDEPNAFIIPGAESQVHLVAAADVTTSWQQTWPDFTNSWDLKVTEPSADGGDTYRIASGFFNLSPQHTR